MGSAPEVVRRPVRLALRTLGAVSFVTPLLTRLVLGQAFFLTGRGKLLNFDDTVSFFTELGIPFPAANAAFVSRLEYYGGIALVIGLLTRLFATGLASTMVVALLTADRASFRDALWLRGEAGLTDVTPFVYLLLLLWLIFFGPGALSLDALLRRWIRPEPAAKT